jgi:hypothetical protein
MSSRKVGVIEDFKNQLGCIHMQLSRLIDDPRLLEVSIRPLGGGGPPSGGVCRLTDDIHTREDFVDALNKIHQWIGYIIEVLEPNHKITKPVR